MEMYPHADSVVRTLMPAVLDAGGMRQVASVLRTLAPLTTAESAETACGMLARIREGAERAAQQEWRDLVEEAAFWAEAAVRCALEGDAETFRFCAGKIRGTMDEGAALVARH